MLAPRSHALVEPLCEALLDTGRRLAGVMRQVADPSVPAIGEWDIGETAAHVAGSADAFLAVLRGDAPPERLEEVDAANAQGLADDPERDPGTLADRLLTGDEALVGYARQTGGDSDVQPFEGVEVPLSTVLAIELGELLVHGFDIARAAGLPWRIEPAAARLTLQGYLPLMPYMLDTERAQGVRLSLEIRIRGLRPVAVSIADGLLTVHDPPEGPFDAHIAAAPDAYLLLTWNRVPAWQALLRGQFLIWGRRPWRATELAALTGA